MKLRVSFCSLITYFRFRKIGGILKIAPKAQIRSISIYPKPKSTFIIGAQSIFSGRISFERSDASVKIGERSYIGKSLLVSSSLIEIGSDVLISWGVTIIDHNSHALNFSQRRSDVIDWLEEKKDWQHVSVSTVRIKNKAWIGFGAVILPGITIGEGAIVGAHAVVTRDVPPWSVVIGNPARKVRDLSEDNMAII